MKYILTLLLATTCCLTGIAQNKHNIFTDVGINYRSISATYDYKLTRHFQLGAGICSQYSPKPSMAQSQTAAYADLRPYWSFRKSTIFIPIGVGAAYNTGPKKDSFWVTPICLYTSLGVGYHYRINKKGMGPYISFMLHGHFLNYHTSRTIYPEWAKHYGVFDATGIFAAGFKF